MSEGRYPDCGHFIEEVAAVTRTIALYAPMLGEGFDRQPYFVDGEMPTSVDEQDGWLVSGFRHGAARTTPGSRRSKTSARGSRRCRRWCICRASDPAQALGIGSRSSTAAGRSGRPSTPLPTVIAKPLSPSIRIRLRPSPRRLKSSPAPISVSLPGAIGPTISFQPHPEFTPAFIGDLLDAYQDRLDPTVVADASARLGTPLSQGMIARSARFCGAVKPPSPLRGGAAAAARATEAGRWSASARTGWSRCSKSG